MATIGTRLYVKLFCKLVGQDEFGNKYYLDKKLDFEDKHKRIVIYNGRDEPTKVPPLWHAWLHYRVKDIPAKDRSYKWQKTTEPNLTGTKYAYYPSGHPLSKKERDLVSGDYIAWKPE